MLYMHSLLGLFSGYGLMCTALQSQDSIFGGSPVQDLDASIRAPKMPSPPLKSSLASVQLVADNFPAETSENVDLSLEDPSNSSALDQIQEELPVGASEQQDPRPHSRGASRPHSSRPHSREVEVATAGQESAGTRSPKRRLRGANSSPVPRTEETTTGLESVHEGMESESSAHPPP